jgi:16S rRNA (cytosine1402-N4)-methyltransferase
MGENVPNPLPPGPTPHRRRPRYSGKYPRRFAEKYKEHDPARYADTVAKVQASGKTAAGTHRPILVDETLESLSPKPGEIVVDCTLGFGGHAREILPRLQPGGLLIGLDADLIELPKTAERLRAAGFGETAFQAFRSNFAGLPKVMASLNIEAVDAVFADLGVSSMQLDNPERGFSFKFEGPLDMRMNPQRGPSAADLIQEISEEKLAALLAENADEPHARIIAAALAGSRVETTTALAQAIRDALPRHVGEEREDSIRRVFQALRITVNDEFGALAALLRALPGVLKAGGRAVILSFHSGEDRRVKKAFEAGLTAGIYRDIAQEIVRPTAAERHANPRSAPAKLRWAIRAKRLR